MVRYFVKRSSIWVYLILPHYLTGVMSFGEEDHRGEVPSSLHQVRGTWHHWDLTFTWPRQCLLHFSTILSIFLVPYKEVPRSCPLQGSGEIKLYLLEGESLYSIYNPCRRSLFSSTYLFLSLFIIISTDTLYLLCTVVIQYCLTYFVDQIVQAFRMTLVSLVFSNSLLLSLQYVPGSSCLFSDPALNSAVSPAAVVPFTADWYLEPRFRHWWWLETEQG